MRNLKRALSLAMASVMLLGMMVVGTSAASFGDVDSSNDLEAIEVMNAVGVMQGDERGFRPNDPINRNEVAKVMALLLNLSPEDYAYAVTPFTDVPDWAAPYVAACYANGITNGTSPSTYSGGDNVTAIQAARMMLRALGYLKNPEDDGDDWVLATATQASKIGLFSGVNQTGVNAALARGQVATMALNALESDMVEDHSEKGLKVDTPDGTTVQVGYTPDYRKITYSSEGDRNYATPAGGGSINDDGYNSQQLCEYLYGTDLKKTGDTTDEFGRPGATWKYKGKELVGSAKTPLMVYTAKAGGSTVEKDLRGYKVGTSENNSYKINDDTVPNRTYSIVYNDGELGSITMNNKTPASQISGLTQAGTRVEIYAEEDVINNIVVINTYLAKVTGVADNDDGTYTVTVNVRNRGNLTDTTVDVRDSSYAKGDMVLVTADIQDQDIKTIEKVNTVTGEITATKADGNSTYIKLDGTQYFTAKRAYDYNDGAALDEDNLPDVNDKLTAYVKDGVVYGLDEVVDAVKDYLYVIAAEDSLDAVQAKVAFSDGTQAKVDIVELDGKDYEPANDAFKGDSSDTAVNNLQNTVFVYSKDGDDYTLETPKDNSGSACGGETNTAVGSYYGKIENDSANVIVDDGGDGVDGSNTDTKVTATNKTVFVDVKGKKAYTGYKNVPDVDNAKMSWGGRVAGLAEIIFVSEGDFSDSDAMIFYVRGNTPEKTKMSGGAKLQTYDVYVDGVKTSLTTKDMTNADVGNDYMETYSLQPDTVYYAKTVSSEGYLTKVKTDGSSSLNSIAIANGSNKGKLSFTIPSDTFSAYNDGNVSTAKNGVLELVGGIRNDADAYDKSYGTNKNPKTTFTYDGDTVFMVVTAKKDGSKGDSVTWGDAGDIVTAGSWAKEEECESTVYVLEVDDDNVVTPKATLVLVIQAKKP